jgi:hypothetical protein
MAVLQASDDVSDPATVVLHVPDGISRPATTVLHARMPIPALAEAVHAPGEAFPRREGDVPASRDVVHIADGACKRRRRVCACLATAGHVC